MTTLKRHHFAVLIALFLLPAVGTVTGAHAADGYKPKVERLFAAWIEDLWPEAEAKGVSRATFTRAFKGVSLDWKLPDLELPEVDGYDPAKGKKPKKNDKQQAEFGKPGRYFPQGHINRMVAQGRTKLNAWKQTLDKIEKQYDVQREVIVAVWGRETAYGNAKLPHYAVRTIATQAFMGRRQKFFREQVLTALEILEAGHIAPRTMKSSWAGAMGHTQFMPSDFQKYAVDFSGDGKRDIWGTVPDALASTANYLRQEGWEAGKTWGYEIEVPKGFDCTLEGLDSGRPISEWVKLGVKRTRGRKFSDERLRDTGYILMPAGRYGPAFIALKNFYVLKTYNFSDLYALFVGHLADRMGNNRPFDAGWSKAQGFRRDKVRDLQLRLEKRGLNVGGADGLIGWRSRVAIGTYQKDSGLAPTCWPDSALFDRARKSIKLGAN